MSNPSFSNIDRWLFEFVEGNLTPEQEAQLKAFIMLHPKLDIDLDAWKDAYIHQEKIDFPDKHRIQKRRPVGLYMSLGFSFMGGMIIVGFFSQFSELGGLYDKSRLKEVAFFNSYASDPNGSSVPSEDTFLSNADTSNPKVSVLDLASKVSAGSLSGTIALSQNLADGQLYPIYSSNGSDDQNVNS